MTDSLEKLLLKVEKFIDNPKERLPEDIFYFISKLTPLVNVDLLIKNDLNETLLTWRDDNFYGPAWHIPGGIIRFREKFDSRILKVAMQELGAEVTHEENPIAIRELFAKGRDIRGHFISLLCPCRLKTKIKADPYLEGEPQHGQWAWHKNAPDNLLTNQLTFVKYINEDFKY